MRVLFLNYTFPGPFLQLAAAFGRMEDTTVLFAAEYGRRDFSLPGVQRVVLSRPRERNQKDKSLLSEQDRLEWDMSMAFQRGRMTASSFSKLREYSTKKEAVPHRCGRNDNIGNEALFPEPNSGKRASFPILSFLPQRWGTASFFVLYSRKPFGSPMGIGISRGEKVRQRRARLHSLETCPCGGGTIFR